ncbi:hypothetical protein GCK72_000772 [Caenorhabditis remanei]|uniref:Uncharacterized protein n=1 Tax=Caenorhabditis remanei TaxID=31234 RepID=A0A6A5HMU1_CAERE|nr:hypothetical protein GCK72_000772 [Caenorhabditis remanei]KAF1768959.1 hypothetical protein GCK72_000772 [Caenorhabditis remanei]
MIYEFHSEALFKFRDKKPVNGSRKSGRKAKAPTEESNKNNLPAALLPKFPSQKILKKKSSDDTIEVAPMVTPEQIPFTYDDEDKEKAENHWEEPMLVIDELQDNENELERQMQQLREVEMQEAVHVSPVDQPSVDSNAKKSSQPEKPAVPVDRKVDKPSGREKKSDRMKNKKERSLSSDEKKSAGEKNPNPVMLKKKASAENANSDEVMRKSARKSKRQKKSAFKPVVQKPGCPPSQGPTSIYQVVPACPKTDRSLKLPIAEQKSYDDRGRKARRDPQPPAPKPPPAKSPLPSNAALTAGAQAQGAQGPPGALGAPGPQGAPRKKIAFMKNVLKKTKFWRRADCVADPSQEMLTKLYVKPDYDTMNPYDFVPDLQECQIYEYDIRKRLVNTCCGRDEVFINKRPFWLNRTATDVIPKVRIQLHRPLKQMYLGNPASVLPKLSRPETKYEPSTVPLEMLVALDPMFGIDLSGKTPKENELNRVCANTFHATIQFEMEKQAWDKLTEQGKKEAVRMRKLQEEMDNLEKQKKLGKKISSCEDLRRVSFKAEGELHLNVYNRKHRYKTVPPSGEVKESGRLFARPLYTKIGSMKSRKRSQSPSRSPLQSSSSTSVPSSASSTSTSPADTKKI